MFAEKPDEPDLSEHIQYDLALKQNDQLFKAARVRLPGMYAIIRWQSGKNTVAEWPTNVTGVLTYTLNDANGKPHNIAVMFGVRQYKECPDNWSAVFYEHATPMYAIHTENGGEVKASVLSYYGKKSGFWRFMQRYFDLAGVRVLHHDWFDGWGD